MIDCVRANEQGYIMHRMELSREIKVLWLLSLGLVVLLLMRRKNVSPYGF